MRVRRWLVLAIAVAVGGCAEEEEESVPVRAPVRELRCAEIPRAIPDDSFWLAQAITEANRPPPAPIRQTISLGFAGDEPLSNGVMRDTPMPPR